MNKSILPLVCHILSLPLLKEFASQLFSLQFDIFSLCTLSFVQLTYLYQLTNILYISHLKKCVLSPYFPPPTALLCFPLQQISKSYLYLLPPIPVLLFSDFHSNQVFTSNTKQSHLHAAQSIKLNTWSISCKSQSQSLNFQDTTLPLIFIHMSSYWWGLP